MAPQTATSSIAMALAGKTASVDIPKPRSNLTAATRDPSRSTGHTAMLPTPPNSISPTLHPHVAFTSKHSAGANNPNNLAATPPLATSHPDSDLDLGDAVDHGQGHAVDSTGAITPAMLAKYHLPGIMLHQGPLPIRHVMGCLTTSVPGFSRIPPAKARRVVVAALEGRGNDQEGGGLDGDVIFEKVGWGRWDARRRGEPSRHHYTLEPSPPSSLPNSFQQRGVQIPSRRADRSPYGTSMTGDSIVFSYTEADYGGRHEDASMLEDEADKMSLDGDANGDSSEAPEEDIPDGDWGEEDVTDEEDWAHIGADALRARSLNGNGGFIHPKQQAAAMRGGGPASSTLAKSAPNNNIPIKQLGFSLPEGVGGDREERAAVEALLRLGSM